MAEQVAVKQERNVVAANPYNAKKEYSEDRNDVPRGLMGVNDGRSDNASNAPVNRGEAPVNEQATSATPYEPVDYKKRYDDLKKHYDDKINTFKSREKELQEKLSTNKPDYKPPKTPEELATFRQEHPDIYEVAETVAHQRAQEELRELKSKVEALEGEKTEALRARAEVELRQLHPDFEEMRESQDFQSWAVQQSDEIQRWLFENSINAKLTARALDLYKLDRGMLKRDSVVPAQTETRRPDAADAVVVKSLNEVQGATPKIWKSSDIRKMSVQQYSHYKDDIANALREGRVIKD